jgi:hypothetical protein
MLLCSLIAALGALVTLLFIPTYNASMIENEVRKLLSVLLCNLLFCSSLSFVCIC